MRLIAYWNHFYRVEDTKALWNAVQDLVSEEQAIDVKEVGYQFLYSLIEGQYSNLGLLRLGTIVHQVQYCRMSGTYCNNAAFFRILGTHNAQYCSIMKWKLQILKQLTKNGRDLSPFEVRLCCDGPIAFLRIIQQEIGYLLLQWLTGATTGNEATTISGNNAVSEAVSIPSSNSSSIPITPTSSDTSIVSSSGLPSKIIDSEYLNGLLSLLTNITKYSFAFIEEPAKTGIIKSVCTICNNSTNIATVEGCITYFDVIVCNSQINVLTN